MHLRVLPLEHVVVAGFNFLSLKAAVTWSLQGSTFLVGFTFGGLKNFGSKMEGVAGDTQKKSVLAYLALKGKRQ